jgi:hypothetical protein
MSSKAHADRLAKILVSSGICETVKTDFTPDQVRILMRITPGAESIWTQLIDRVLMASEYLEGQAHGYQAHICKNYFRKKVNGEAKLVFGWYFSIQSVSMSDSLDVVSRAVRGNLPEMPADRGEIEELPLATRVKELNLPNENGRGGWSVGGKTDFKPLRR